MYVTFRDILSYNESRDLGFLVIRQLPASEVRAFAVLLLLTVIKH